MYKLTSYNIINQQPDGMLLIFNTLSKAVIKVTKQQFKNAVNSPNDLTTFLLNSYILCDELMDEKQYFKFVYDSFKYETKQIGITFVPSRKCNLRCKYCIQDNLFNNNTSVEITKKVINDYYDWLYKFIKRWGTKKIEFNFYGGEPLVSSPDTLLYLFEKFDDLPVEKEYIMVTNGTLITAHPQIMKYVNVYRITIDGAKNIHDSRRVRVDGGGTYDAIIENIQGYLQEYDPKGISIRINVDKYNRMHLKESADRIISDIGSSKIDFRLFPVVPTTGDISYIDIHDDMSITAKYMHECYSYLKKNYNIHPFIFSTNCGVSSVGKWVFDTNGLLYKCCSVIGHEDKAVGSIYSNALNANFYKALDRNYDDECSTCPYLCYCGGGCKLQETLHGKKQCLKEFYNVYLPQMINIMYNKDI